MQPHDVRHPPKLPQPVIAKVQGAAAAAGCQLVAQCDLAIAVDTAKFVTSGVTWGFFCSPRRAWPFGRNSAQARMEMLLEGDPISAQQAMEWGLVNKVVPVDQLDAATARLAAKLAARAAGHGGRRKRGFYQQMDMNLEQAYARSRAR